MEKAPYTVNNNYCISRSTQTYTMTESRERDFIFRGCKKPKNINC